MSVANQQSNRAAIEKVVREVLRRLQRAGKLNPVGAINSNPVSGNPACSVKSTTPSGTQTSAGPQQSDCSFECIAKVISMETLRGKLDNINTLRVKPKAIITPAARDELRDRKIQIAFDLGAACKSGAVPATILLGTTCNSTGNSLRDQLISSGTQVRLHVEKSAAQLATKVSNKISASMPAVIVADHPYSAACSANRNSRVRAVVIGDPNELRAAKDELNPNCVVIKSGNEGRFNLSYVLNQLT